MEVWQGGGFPLPVTALKNLVKFPLHGGAFEGEGIDVEAAEDGVFVHGGGFDGAGEVDEGGGSDVEGVALEGVGEAFDGWHVLGGKALFELLAAHLDVCVDHGDQLVQEGLVSVGRAAETGEVDVARWFFGGHG